MARYVEHGPVYVRRIETGTRTDCPTPYTRRVRVTPCQQPGKMPHPAPPNPSLRERWHHWWHCIDLPKPGVAQTLRRAANPNIPTDQIVTVHRDLVTMVPPPGTSTDPNIRYAGPHGAQRFLDDLTQGRIYP